MKVFLITLFSLILISCSDTKKPIFPETPSGWKLIGESENSTYSIYESDVKEFEEKNGKFIHFWILSNFIKEENKKYSEGSSKTKFIMNCKSKSIRPDRIIVYSKFNGEGESISDTGSKFFEMNEIVPQSIGETYFTLLCTKNPFSKYLFVPVK